MLSNEENMKIEKQLKGKWGERGNRKVESERNNILEI